MSNVKSVLWIKVSENGVVKWVNTSRLRAIEQDTGRYAAKGSTSVLVFNTKHKIRVDQSVDEVLTALGYPPPPPQPLETHVVEHPAVDSGFAETASLATD